MSDCGNCPANSNVLIAPPPATAAANGIARSHVVALVGPPNSGKTTLFNRLTGLRQKVANFPGVTVEHHLGKLALQNGREAYLVDLPGVYSLTARSEDERVTRDVLAGEMKGIPKPDAVLLILDCTNLARHLLLAAPVLSLGLPTLVILNMADDLRNRGGEIDAGSLGSELGAPVALISAAKGEGLDKVWQFLNGTTLGAVSEPAFKRVELPVLNDIPQCHKWATNVGKKADYHAPAPPHWTRRLDSIFLHPIAGPLIFLAVVIAVFQSIFYIGNPLGDALKDVLEGGGNKLAVFLPDNWIRSLLIDGIWKGVGSVLVFLPQILMLFLFIGLLEDSGYLARAALIADRTMSRFGLQGKAFIPLLSAYSCAVPAIMATRTIENKRDRIATIMIAPFMTCSARIPVYTLIIAAFIPEQKLIGGLLGTQAAAMLGLYVLGFIAAILTARVLKSTILKSGRSTFMLEMPSYRWPTVRSLALRLYDRTMVFLKRAGTLILLVQIVLWLFLFLPAQHNGKGAPIEHSIAGSVGHAIEPVIKPLGFNWKVGIGLIASLAAREVIVGTLGTIYGVEGEGESAAGLRKAIRADLSPGGACALLVFFAFALQCMSTLAVVKRETGTWAWPVGQFVYMGLLAYVCAFITNVIVSRIWV
ncbi:MAG TPA: ferrous iron transport protein B [Bryobacteraceae bacterium]|jgi:ferrous iron transport protein B